MEHNHMLFRPKGDARDSKESLKQLRSLDSAQLPAIQPLEPLSLDPFLHASGQKHSPLLPSIVPPPPPSYTHHEPASLSFPDVPATELAPIQLRRDVAASNNNSLPSLSSVTGPHSQQRFNPSRTAEGPGYSSPPPPPRVNHWPSLNPLTAYYTPSHLEATESPQKMDVDTSGNHIAALSAASPDQYYDGRASSVSLDDPDVRMAAEALGDLRADFVSSPPNRPTPLPGTSPSARFSSETQTPEPLLSLLTESHPLLATTIEGATSAYNNSKNFSPRFKSSAEYVEGYLTPIANTVGSVGRATGVEGSVRWFLGSGRRHQSSSSDLEAGDHGSNKRRKVDVDSTSDALDVIADRGLTSQDPYAFTKERRASMSTVDTLPAYDDQRSPAYTEVVETKGQVASRPAPTSAGSQAAWQQRLIMSTSGLSIAMSEESLRSLKYCLHWLRWANEHIAKIIAALKSTLEQYDSSASQQLSGEAEDGFQGLRGSQSGASMGPSNPGHDSSELLAKITALKGDVLKTLRDVIDTVSKYAGGALPENARILVRRHLTSLPQRFRLATMNDSAAQGEGEDVAKAKEMEARDGAQKVLVLAKEGLDMMSQVSGVLDGTIVSAEEWCDRLGKKKRDDRESLAGTSRQAIPSPVSAEPLVGVGIDADMS